ncbi:MAG: TonB-dependent receptor plug domain-containing protein [Neisseria sp.]|uniref:TonB-dependent siderophore receptor n=1 Tax=Neisseria sp. TaxID=192066 RepID=UPI0026DB0EE8|nr:TonB-dependent receptor plug domain-containing protein [Neisseria sp.]MDO4641154.1 TonB-dependent receptor plug domain-containing protein [Neisseria sp.]
MLLACYQTAFAETQPETESKPTQVDTVHVHGARKAVDNTEKTGSYTIRNSNTATGLTISGKDTPQSVSAITKQQLNDRAITRVEDALQTATGVNVVRDSGLQTRFQSRGFYVDQIGEDGITINVAGRSGYSAKIDVAPTTDLAVYDHIEVVRGATGLTQSQSEPGGTINLIRKRPTTKFQHLGEISVDRWGTLRGMADVSGSLNKEQTIRGRLVGVAEKNESFKDRVDGKKRLIYGVLDADLSEKTVLTLGGLYQTSTEKPDFAGVMLPCENPKPSYFGQRRLPTCVEPVTLPRNTYLGANWSRHHINKTNSFFKLGHYFANGWKLNTEASYTDIDSDTKIGQPFSDSKVARGVANKLSPQYSDGWKYDRMLINPISYTKSNKQLGIKFDFTGTYDLFNHTHDAYLGYSYNRENINSQYAQIFDSDTEYNLIRGNFGNAGTCQAVRDKRYKIVGFNGSEVPEPNWGLYDGKGNHQVYQINCKDAYIRESGQPNPEGAFVTAQYNFDHY